MHPTSTERWENVKQLFMAALEHSPGERERFIRHICHTDASLAAEVLDLLSHHDGGPDEADRLVDQSADLAPSETPPPLIGPYRTIRPLGEGGMGVVYLAERQRPFRRTVAIKVIKPGMDSRQVIARFESERQALALMNHPNIAAVYDAGMTSDHRPYFVMEFVAGEPITRFCDRHQFTIRQRLELFVQACEAIQHAHAKAIVHRDIKPSNLLVTMQNDQPLLKVIDFGVAKAMARHLTGQTMFTTQGQLVGTPEYMSPEQAELDALDVDTRTDIYSLGVVLYELLSGALPFEPKALREAAYNTIRHIIQEVDPPRPSTRLSSLGAAANGIAARRQTHLAALERELRGELEWIPLKAMRKDRAQRYGTASEMAQDIRAYLEHRALLAGPESIRYRARKFLRRNRGPVMAIALMVLLLLVGIVGTTTGLVQAISARRAEILQRARAELNEARAREQATRALEQLRESHLAHARALRLGDRAGRRSGALELLSKAAAIRSGPDVRDEAIACLLLADLAPQSEWTPDPAPADPGVAHDLANLRYASADGEGNISVRSTLDQSLLAHLPGVGPELVWVLKFSPDGRFLAAKYADERLRLWDLESGHLVLEVPEVSYGAARFSDDSRRIALGRPDGMILLFETATGAELKRIASDISPPYAVRFDPGGRSIAVSSHVRAVVRLLDVESGRTLMDLAHPTNVRGMSFSPDGAVLATAGADSRIYLWDIDSRQLHAVLEGHPAPVVAVAFNHAGDLLASLSWDGTTRLWNPKTHETLCASYSRALLNGEFSPDDQQLGFERRLNLGRWTSAGVWKVFAGRERRSLGRVPASSGSFSPDGNLLITCGTDSVQFWDVHFNKEVFRLEIPGLRAAILHPQGTHLIVAAGDGLYRWPIDRSGPGEDLHIGARQSLNAPGAWNCLSISDDGSILAVTGQRYVRVFKLTPEGETFALLYERAFRWGANFVSVSPDGKWVASPPWNETGVKVWNVPTGDLVAELPLRRNGSVRFSPDSAWLVTGNPEEYQFWSVGSWSCQHSVARNGATDRPGTITFAPGGELLVLTRGGDHDLVLIEPATGAQLARLEEGLQVPLAFSPDGCELAVVGDRSRLQIWDLRLVREQLADLGLDWNAPPYPAREARVRQRPLRVTLAGSQERAASAPERPPEGVQD